MDPQKFIVIPDLLLKSPSRSSSKRSNKKRSSTKQIQSGSKTVECASDEEMDMLYFLKNITPSATNASVSTRIAPEEDEIDIYQFLHTSVPPLVASPLPHARNSDSETETMSSCVTSDDEVEEEGEVDMFEFLRSTDPILHTHNNNNNNDDNTYRNNSMLNSSTGTLACSSSSNSDASTSEDEDRKEVSIYEFLQTTPPTTSSSRSATNNSSSNNSNHTDASTTKLSVLKKELLKILKDVRRRHASATSASSANTTAPATITTKPNASSILQPDSSINDIINILDFISLSSSSATSSPRLEGAPASPRTRAEVDELELIDFLKTTSPTVPRRDAERMKKIKTEMGNIVRDLMTGKKKKTKKRVKQQKHKLPRSPTSPRSPRPQQQQPPLSQTPHRKPLKKEGSMRKLERFFGLIHGYDDDQVMDEAMQCATNSEDGVCGAVVGGGGGDMIDSNASSDDCHDEQLEQEVLHSIIHDCQINYDDLTFGRKIGEGAYAEVYIGTLRDTQVAIKLLKDAPTRQLLLNSFIREVTCLKKAAEIGRVVQLLGCCIAPQCCIVLEYVNGGSVADYLNASYHKQLSLREAVKCAKDISEAMSHLHSLHPPIIHRDLSPSNILLHLDNNGNVYEALLSDFGIARGKDEKGLQLLSPVGHPRYRAPEVSKKQPYSKKVDVYCFGSCMYEMFSGHRLFNEMTDAEVCRMRLRGDVLLCDDAVIPKTLRKLINRCWSVTPKHRPAFKEVTHILDKELKKLDRAT